MSETKHPQCSCIFNNSPRNTDQIGQMNSDQSCWADFNSSALHWWSSSRCGDRWTHSSRLLSLVRTCSRLSEEWPWRSERELLSIMSNSSLRHNTLRCTQTARFILIRCDRLQDDWGNHSFTVKSGNLHRTVWPSDLTVESNGCFNMFGWLTSKEGLIKKIDVQKQELESTVYQVLCQYYSRPV